MRFRARDRWCFGILQSLTHNTATVLYLGRTRRMTPADVRPWPPKDPPKPPVKSVRRGA